MRRAVPLLLLRYSYLVGCGGQFQEHLFEVSFEFCWPRIILKSAGLTELLKNERGPFYPSDTMCYSYGPVSVCLSVCVCQSQAGIVVKWLRGSSWLIAEPSFDVFYTVLIWVPQNNVTFSRSLSGTWNLQNLKFRHSTSIVAPCQLSSITGRSGLVVSASDCGVRGPRFESHRGRFCYRDSRCDIQPWARAAHFTAVHRSIQPSTLCGILK